jgi:hypothetical protein
LLINLKIAKIGIDIALALLSRAVAEVGFPAWPKA